MKIFSKKWGAAIAVIAVIAASGFVTEHFMGFNPISTGVNFITSPIKSGFSYVAHSIENARDFIWEMRAYKSDNEQLAAENARLKQENSDTASLRAENERLSSLLETKNQMTSYVTVAATVTSCSGNSWCEELEINKGTMQGIKEGNPVITADGVVGRVSKAGPDYSVITTILDKSSAVGIKFSRTGSTGMIEGDKDLAENIQCKLSFIDRDATLIVGDVIETSGTSGIYPPGIIVGTVSSISADSTGALNYAVVDPSADLGNMHEVLVITG